MFPEFQTASLVSILFFWWVTPLITTGYRKTLEENEVFDITNKWKPESLVERFWEAKATRSTWKALWVTFRRDMILSGIMYLISVALRFVGPLLLNVIVSFISENQAGQDTGIDTPTAFGFAALLCACQVIGSLLSVHADFIAMRVGLNARDALTACTFRHLTVLSNNARAKTNNGLIMSLISNDAMVALEFTRFWNQAWTSPFVLVGGIVYIHVLVGVSVWAGMSILVIFVPFSMYLAKAQTHFQRRKMTVTDHRIKLSSEALQGIRVVKFNAWEAALERVLEQARIDELTRLRALEYVRAVTTPLSVAMPNVASVLTFITYVAIGNELDPANTFSVISLFVIIRAPFVTFPIAIAQFSRAIVMSNRFDEFFKLERNPERALEAQEAGLNHGSFIASINLPAKSDEGKRLEPSGSVNFHTPLPSMSSFSTLGAIQQPSFKRSFALLAGRPPSVTIDDGSEFTWRDEALFRLQVQVPIKIELGEFIAIVGSVGSGKTALLLSMLGEMHTLKGGSTRNGRIAYCAQEPFILNATLRENILFGSPFDANRYVKAIHLSCLDGDIDQLPGLDMCEIGARGVNLSGGQKARVALARALYSDADVLFLDDVLSAVDAHVGRKILDNCLRRMPTRTRILVTNNLYVLSHVNRVLVIVDGVVKEFGPVQELLRNENGALVHITRDMVEEESEQPARQDTPANGHPKLLPPAENRVELAPQDGNAQDAAKTEDNGQIENTVKPLLMAQHSEPELFAGHADDVVKDYTSPSGDGIWEDPFNEDNLLSHEMMFMNKILEPERSLKGAQLTAKENREKGTVSGTVFKAYWLAGSRDSYIIVFLLLMTFVVAEGVFLAVDGYLAEASQQDSISTNRFLATYASLSAAAVIGILMRSFCFAIFHLAAVRVLYQGLAKRILRFPMVFYWKEPLGRLLNRLSGDTNIMDTMLGQSWLWLLLTIVRVLGILVLICIAVPIFAAALVPLFFLYFYFREVYRRSSTDLQRLEAVSKSPIMNILTETLQGASTIRAYGKVSGWIKAADEKVIANTRTKFSVESLAVWLTLYLEFVGALVVLLTGLIVVAARNSIGSGFAGLALAYSFNIVINLNFSVKQAVMVEQQMSAVERLCEYNSIETEANLDDVPKSGQGTKSVDKASPTVDASSSLAIIAEVPSEWPTRGEITFEDVSLRYRPDLEFALKNLSFRLAAGERCGICGKTGGGKSSLFVALLRLVDCSDGRILIDGVDTTSVSKRHLRSKITIVPQDPVVFRGSLRYNLDPFNERSDAEVWEALRASHIARIAEANPDKLQMEIADNGSNLSVGERALICMARAILRKSRIVCLDEASSALDSNTDNLIQQTIRDHFQDASLLVIAHRLDTVIDLDSILVMGQGRVVEKDSPHALLSRPDSAFAALVEETGKVSARILREKAAEVAAQKASRQTASV